MESEKGKKKGKLHYVYITDFHLTQFLWVTPYEN